MDGYRLSTYLYKNRRSAGGKIVVGPAWDYNIAWWNANYCSGNLTTGWAYNFNNVCGTDDNQVPFWWQRLLQDPAFTAALKCRWTDLRHTELNTDSLDAFIDANAARLNEAQARHFTAWPILGVYTWPNPTPIPASYPAEIAALKNWLKARLLWLDANMPGTCSRPLAVQAVSAAASSQVFPNPFDTDFTFSTTLPAQRPGASRAARHYRQNRGPLELRHPGRLVRTSCPSKPTTRWLPASISCTPQSDRKRLTSRSPSDKSTKKGVCSCEPGLARTNAFFIEQNAP